VAYDGSYSQSRRVGASPALPNFSRRWIEMVGTEGAIMVDDTHRDVS